MFDPFDYDTFTSILREIVAHCRRIFSPRTCEELESVYDQDEAYTIIFDLCQCHAVVSEVWPEPAAQRTLDRWIWINQRD